MFKSKPRVQLPDTIKSGDVLEIKALVRHQMERGHRQSSEGKTIARNIIHTFTAAFDGENFFQGNFGTGVASDPFISFRMRATKSGTLTLTWTDDTGATIEAERRIHVETS